MISSQTFTQLIYGNLGKIISEMNEKANCIQANQTTNIVYYATILPIF